MCLPADAPPYSHRGDGADATAGTSFFPTPPEPHAASHVAYLRTGRQRLGRGKIVDCYENGSVKILPSHRSWKHVVVSPEEINAATATPHGRKPANGAKIATAPLPIETPAPPALPHLTAILHEPPLRLVISFSTLDQLNDAIRTGKISFTTTAKS